MSEPILPPPSSRGRRRTPSEDAEIPLPFFKEVYRQIRLAWRLLWDPRVSWALKLIPPLTLLYLISPIDILPDWVIPGLGELDDVAVIMLGVKLFIELSPLPVVREHLRDLGLRLTGRSPDSPPTIDGEFSVEGEE